MGRSSGSVIVVSAGIMLLASNVACLAQSPVPSSAQGGPVSSTAGAPLAEARRIDFASLEAKPTAAELVASEAANGAPPAVASPSEAAATAPAPLVPPIRNDAAIKELAEMKKQLDQMNQMQALIKAKMSRLENELNTDPSTGDSVSAERDADAIRAAETGGVSDSLPIGQAAQAPPPAPAVPEISGERTTKEAPFPGDWTWLNNNGHQVDSPMATKYFTPEIRTDANYNLDYNHPKDDTLGGSTETFTSGEWQLEQVSVGGDFRLDNVRGRFLCLCGGLWAVTTTRNDPSVVRGDWDLSGAYKYVAEGWGGYHWDVNHGLNVDAGIFVSYVGLFSYYNFDNWTYQPSFVSSNTPWFFNGMRIQWFPTSKLKIEPWLINGWQTYARPNGKPGLGGQILWRPTQWLDVVTNNYGLGEDDPGYPGRSRVHTDNSVEVKYYDQPTRFMDKMAFTVTGDLGCEYGGGGPSFAVTAQTSYTPNGLSPEMGTSSTYNGGVHCHNSKDGRPKQSFEGWMMYQRFWFKKDVWGLTLGGGQMSNPGRYLTLLPPINKATAVTGSPYFTQNPGDAIQQHDGTITLDYMPSQFITFRLETGYRYSNQPYWTGHGGITPPGGANGSPSDYQCAAGGDSGYGYVYTSYASSSPVGVSGQPLAIQNCQNLGLSNGYNTSGDKRALWWPDLRTNQTVSTLAIMVRF